MQITWNDKDPIYRQLRDRIVELVLENVFKEGESLPSVRQVAKDHRINPLTVSKAYQMLVEEGLIEKRRGLGMFVAEGALDRLILAEKESFLEQEWPLVKDKIRRLGLDKEDLMKTLSAGGEV